MFKDAMDTIEQTCYACPSQWEGLLKDGRGFYVRYRWGTLQVTVSRSKVKDVGDWSIASGSIILCEQVGDPMDGVMTTDEMMYHAGDAYV